MTRIRGAVGVLPETARNVTELAGVHPHLAEVLNRVRAVRRLLVLEGARTDARQAALVKAGRSKKMDGKHTTKPKATAVDVSPVPYNPRMPWDPEVSALVLSAPEARAAVDNAVNWAFLMGQIHGAGLAMGVKLRPGLFWDHPFDITGNGFRDVGHIELVDEAVGGKNG